MSTEDSTGRVAVVTGASSGIGEATARALTADGYRVALLARRLDRIRTLAHELGDDALAIEADVTDRDSILAASRRVQAELGRLDVLINNAGVMLLGPFSAELSGDYRRMVETNLLGAITTTEVFLDQLIADGGGDLINLSSVAGRTARPGNAVYAATKWGMNGWSESLRQQLQPDVRVIVIEPGAVATELTDHITHPETSSGSFANRTSTPPSTMTLVRYQELHQVLGPGNAPTRVAPPAYGGDAKVPVLVFEGAWRLGSRIGESAIELALLANRICCPDCGAPLAPWGHAREREVRMGYGGRLAAAAAGAVRALRLHARVAGRDRRAAPARLHGGDRPGAVRRRLRGWASDDRGRARSPAWHRPRLGAGVRAFGRRAEALARRGRLAVGDLARRGGLMSVAGRVAARLRRRGAPLGLHGICGALWTHRGLLGAAGRADRRTNDLDGLARGRHP